MHAELGELVRGDKPGRTSADQITLYKSVGVAVQDVAAAALVLEAARAKTDRNRHRPGGGMTEVKEGLEGVVAFRTRIAEPDREGGALRYRGVDIEELVGHVPFEQVWGLLVDEALEPGLPPAEPYAAKDLTGDAPADLQAVTAALGGEWRLGKLIDITDAEATEDLRRLSATMISVVAQSARVADGHPDPVGPCDGRPAAAPPQSGSCSSGAARPTPSTSERSRRTGSARPSTA